MRTAYLVLWLNTETHTVASAGVYSEPSPSTCRPHFPLSVWEYEAADYHEASKHILDSLADGTAFEFQWVRPLLGSTAKMRRGCTTCAWNPLGICREHPEGWQP